MPYVKKLLGKTHKYHTGSKFTRCGKKINKMWDCGKGSPKSRCSSCWES